MELSILHAIQIIRNPIFDHVMIFFSITGNRGMIWIIIALTFLCIKKYRKCGIVVLLSLFAAVLIGNTILKHLVERARPCWVDTTVTLLITNPKDFSFPSGHTYSSFAAATSIFLYHKNMGKIALLLAFLIAFSRLYLFVHYPTDVLAGAILGALTAYIIAKIYNRYGVM
ncbi:MAG: phosphatase PAP2 family protein [Velocimicrobium sp.]